MAVFERSSDYYKEIVVLIEDFSPSSSSAGNSQFFLWLFTAAKSALNQIAIKVKQMSIKLYEQTVSLFMQKQS
jgi:hypothetical protein